MRVRSATTVRSDGQGRDNYDRGYDHYEGDENAKRARASQPLINAIPAAPVHRTSAFASCSVHFVRASFAVALEKL
jgi:hypothetical protein